MATYVNDLRLKEIATGDESGTWGTSTNTNLELIGEALGYGTEAITTNDDTHTTTVADGSTDPGRAMYIKYTGALDSDCTITIAPNTMSRVHFIENATTDSGSSGPYNIIISQGSGANVTIPNSHVKAVFLDGAGSGAAVTEAFADLSIGPNLRIGNAAAEDTAIVFDGNAQDFYIGLDDSADDLIIGLGSTVGTTPIISIDENKDVAIPDGGLTITTDDNTAQLTLKSTDADASAGPKLDLFRDSGSPADDDILGKIRFLGDNDSNSQLTYADIEARIVDASNGSEDGRLELSTALAGSGSVSRIFMDATETIINNDSKDLDFRVESDGNANMLFVDGGNNFIGVGTNSPQSAIHIATTGPILSFTDTNSFSDTNDRFIVRASSNQGDIQWYDDSASSTIGFMEFSPSGGITVNDGQSSNINFIAKAGSSTNALQVDGSSGAVTINEASADADFRVESDGNANALLVDAGNNFVSIGSNAQLGAISGGLPLNAGIFRTFSDVVGASNNTATTMVSLPTDFATYIACVGFNGVGNTNLYGASAVIHSDGTSHTLTHLANPSNMTLSMSGSNVQATQTSGATLNISFSIIRIQ